MPCDSAGMNTKPLKDEGLNLRQAAFCDEYVKDGNASRAAREAGYSPATAPQHADYLLKSPKVQQAIDARVERRLSEARAAAERAGLTLDLLMQQTKNIVAFDPRKLFDEDGNPLQIKDLDAETASWIAAV